MSMCLMLLESTVIIASLIQAWKERWLLLRIRFWDYVYILLAAAAIIAIFTVIDYVVHSLSEEYSVPGYYFKNKLIFGTIYCFIGLLIFRNFKIFWKSLFLSGVISILLQTRYYLEGYPREFVLEFLLFHFLMLIPSCLIVMWSYSKLNKVNKKSVRHGRRKEPFLFGKKKMFKV